MLIRVAGDYWRNIAITLIDLAVSPPARAREKGNALEAPLGAMYHSASGEITRRTHTRVLQEAQHLYALFPSARTARCHTL